MFSTNPPPLLDHPLSPQGRFGRLSFIGWNAFLLFVTYMIFVLFLVVVAVLGLGSLSFDEAIRGAVSSLYLIGSLLIMLGYFYFYLVFSIRRLHDLNRSGWWCLLYAIPFISFFLSLYLIAFRGDRHANRYGTVRDTAVWEKILAWLMIISSMVILSIFALLVFALFNSGDTYTPTQMIEKGTAYF